jgi:hypothetical protein
LELKACSPHRTISALVVGGTSDIRHYILQR